jgi:hypothetical protein
MALVRVNTGLFRSQFFWLACVFCLTAGHLPSLLEVVATLIFVALVWQIPRISRWATIGFVFLAYYGLEIVTLLVVRAIPKATWSKLGPSPIGIPAQVAYVGSVSEIGVWAIIVLLALLRFCEVHDQQQQGSCLRFVAASSIIGAVSRLLEKDCQHRRKAFMPGLSHWSRWRSSLHCPLPSSFGTSGARGGVHCSCGLLRRCSCWARRTLHWSSELPSSASYLAADRSR